MRRIVLVTILLAFAAPHARAESCEAEAAELRAHLELEACKAFRWNTLWAIAFGTAAVGQLGFALAEVSPTGGDFDRATEETLYVGATKATIGVLARVTMPLRITVPATSGDACAQVTILRAALAEAGRRERRSFWLTHLGGTALNLAGAGFLTARHGLTTGAVSFAISYPVGPASAYTQPRGSWKKWRAQRATWVVGMSGGDAGAQLWLGGAW
ncbi:MAG: hypothetical protein H0T89_35620 [Deltaproteobacteria bacterium]|nr:hypothetical protein [Deltaproteobacteria bacterium]